MLAVPFRADHELPRQAAVAPPTTYFGGRWHTALVYLAAIAAVLVAALVRAALARALSGSAPLLVFVAPIFIAGYLGGLGPGLFATVLGAGIGSYWFVDITGTSQLDIREYVRIGVFLAEGVLISVLCEGLHRARRRAERNLANFRDSEAQMRLLIDATTDFAIYMLSRDGRVVTWNQGAARIEGYAAEEIIGQHVAIFFPPERPERAMEVLAEAANTGRFEEQGWRIRKGGTRYWADVVITPLRDDHGEIGGFAKVLRDATARREAEQSIADREARLRAILQTASNAIIVINRRGIITSFNPSAERVFGYLADEVTGKNVSILMPEPNQSEHDRYIADYFRTGEAKIIGNGRQVLGLRKSGSTFPAELSVAEMTVGGERMFTGVIRDLTEQQRTEQTLRESLRRFSELAESMPQVVWITDASGTPTYFNRHWYDLTGQTPEQACSPRWIQAIHPDDVALAQEQWKKAVATGNALEIEFRLCRASDGEYRWFLSRGNPVRDDGHIVQWFGASTDIHERKTAQEVLEQRVQKRTMQLVQANEELRAFSYTVSHDLRAPLRTLHGFGRAMVEDYGPGLDETANDYLRRMVAATARMDRLIADLLEYSQLSQSELRAEPVSVVTVIHELISQLPAQDDSRVPQVMVTEPLPWVYGHRPTLRNVLGNLLSNATKFVPEERSAAVRIYGEDANGTARIFFEDNGIGIPAEHHRRIFQPFERLHPPGTFPGTGIGLAIVQRGVERMGGKVGVDSSVGRGSRFWLELPAVPGSMPSE